MYRTPYQIGMKYGFLKHLGCGILVKSIIIVIKDHWERFYTKNCHRGTLTILLTAGVDEWIVSDLSSVFAVQPCLYANWFNFCLNLLNVLQMMRVLVCNALSSFGHQALMMDTLKMLDIISFGQHRCQTQDMELHFFFSCSSRSCSFFLEKHNISRIKCRW